MVGAAYAAVPLYFAFCRATGFAGTTQVRAAARRHKGQRTLTVRFDANVAPGLDWTFEPETSSITCAPARPRRYSSSVHNRCDREDAPRPRPTTSRRTVRAAGSTRFPASASASSGSGPGETRGTAGRVLPRSGLEKGSRDGRGRCDHAVLHAVRAARTRQTGRAGADGRRGAPKL